MIISFFDIYTHTSQSVCHKRHIFCIFMKCQQTFCVILAGNKFIHVRSIHQAEDRT